MRFEKATPPINPGAGDRDWELFSGSTDESGGKRPDCSIGNYGGESRSAATVNSVKAESYTV